MSLGLTILAPGCGDKVSAVPGGSSTGGSSGSAGASHSCSQSLQCDDAISCTIDSCLAGSCSHTIGPNSGETACPAGTFCTVEKGCVPPPACASVDDCLELWGNEACKANVRCEAASSLCLFDLLDKDHDGHSPQVCGGADCDDSDSARHPGHDETCDGKDNDCDGQIDLGATCGGLRVCESGACVCPAAHACGSECVDLQSDPGHCGSCDNACLMNAMCESGTCQCPTGSVACSTICAHLSTDWANCGSCGNSCVGGAKCEAGQCLCPQGLIPCPGGCVDTQASDGNCGSCSHACPAGASCELGQCACPSGQSPCSNHCVDLSSDNFNCGGCDDSCTGGNVCVGGACSCPTGLTACGAECVDLTTAANHCGACGHACSSGLSCSAGVCKDPSCLAAQAQTVKDVATGAVASKVAVELSGAIVTTPKILAYHSNAQGTCMWAVFIRDPAEPFGLMITSYGDDSQPGSDAGPLGCPKGTDDIPDTIAPGDIVNVVGTVAPYVPPGCPQPAPPAQPIVQAQCAMSRIATGPAPEPVVVPYPVMLKNGNQAYRGLVVAVENVDAETFDGGSVGPYGVVRLTPSGLEVHDKFFYTAEGAPQFGPAQHFTRIVGVSHLDYCTWTIQPLSKCTGFTPKSLDCP